MLPVVGCLLLSFFVVVNVAIVLLFHALYEHFCCDFLVLDLVLDLVIAAAGATASTSVLVSGVSLVLSLSKLLGMQQMLCMNWLDFSLVERRFRATALDVDSKVIVPGINNGLAVIIVVLVL